MVASKMAGLGMDPITSSLRCYIWRLWHDDVVWPCQTNFGILLCCTWTIVFP